MKSYQPAGVRTGSAARMRRRLRAFGAVLSTIADRYPELSTVDPRWPHRTDRGPALAQAMEDITRRRKRLARYARVAAAEDRARAESPIQKLWVKLSATKRGAGPQALADRLTGLLFDVGVRQVEEARRREQKRIAQARHVVHLGALTTGKHVQR